MQTLSGQRNEIVVTENLDISAKLGRLEHDAPARLYVIGDISVFGAPALAVAGARRATPYGLSSAARFARLAAERDVCLVTGGARGIDAEATCAALEAGGKCVVVLGGGCDRIYPAGHASLFQRVIDQGGVVISEQEWSCNPLPYMFRKRNRIVAGLAGALLVVECGLPSGTFSAADYALSAGVRLCAVPGAITSPVSLGSNVLLANGATSIYTDAVFNDVLDEVIRQ